MYTPRYLDAKSAAVYLGITLDAIYTLVARRLVPHRRLNTKLIFDRIELDAYIHSLGGVSVEEAVARTLHGGLIRP